MAKRLFVGSLPYSVTQAQLEELFAKAGTVSSVSLITDRQTGNSKGFAFVEMSSDEEATNAIQLLNGTDFEGRALVVNEARPQEDRPRSSFGGGGFGGGQRRTFGGGQGHGGSSGGFSRNRY